MRVWLCLLCVLGPAIKPYTVDYIRQLNLFDVETFILANLVSTVGTKQQPTKSDLCFGWWQWSEISIAAKHTKHQNCRKRILTKAIYRCFVAVSASLLWIFCWKSWLHLDVLSLTLLCGDVHELTTYNRGGGLAILQQENQRTELAENLPHFSCIFWIHSFTLPAVPTTSLLEWEGKESTPNMIASVI